MQGLHPHHQDSHEQTPSLPYVPGAFRAQWCRFTLYLEHISFPAAAAAAAAAAGVNGAGRMFRSGRAHKYFVTYKLPGACVVALLWSVNVYVWLHYCDL